MVTGGAQGELVTWNGNSVGKTYKSSHETGIWAIEKAPGKQAETGFYSGGNEGKVILWNAQFQPTNTIDIKNFVSCSVKPGVRSLDAKVDGTILIGTIGADVLEVDKSGKFVQFVV
jgi:hypothetical protein